MLIFALFFARYWVIFLYRWKNTNILPQIFFQVKNVKKIGIFGQKNGRAGPTILKLSMKKTQVLSKKKPRKQENYSGFKTLRTKTQSRKTDGVEYRKLYVDWMDETGYLPGADEPSLGVIKQ